MNTKNLLAILGLMIAGLYLAGCGPSQAELDAEATQVAANLAATQTAEAPPPTPTPVPPTDTPTPVPPTDTPTPTNTPTPTPTDTPVPPTDTPTPTNTPTSTSTPVPPTDTPAPPADTPVPTAVPATATPEVSQVEIHLERGIEYFQQEQFDQAINEFKEVTRLEPEFGLAFGFLGYSYAYGPREFELAIASLEKYLELMPNADDRAQVEEDIQTMRDLLAAHGPSLNLEVPPGKALFVFINYTNVDWSIDVGPYHMDLPAWQDGQDYPMGTLAIDPGTYIWQAHSPGGGYYITDANGNQSFEFTAAEGEIVQRSVR